MNMNGDWQDFTIPVSKIELKDLRRRYRAEVKRLEAIDASRGVPSEGLHQTVARSLLPNTLKDFDRIILGMAIVSPSHRLRFT